MTFCACKKKDYFKERKLCKFTSLVWVVWGSGVSTDISISFDSMETETSWAGLQHTAERIITMHGKIQ